MVSASSHGVMIPPSQVTWSKAKSLSHPQDQRMHLLWQSKRVILWYFLLVCHVFGMSKKIFWSTTISAKTWLVSETSNSLQVVCHIYFVFYWDLIQQLYFWSSLSLIFLLYMRLLSSYLFLTCRVCLIKFCLHVWQTYSTNNSKQYRQKIN